MSRSLGEDKIETIRELYDEMGNIEKVADETGHSKTTVSKYTEDMRETQSSDDDPEPEKETPPDQTDSGSDQSWFGPTQDQIATAPGESRGTPDFGNMSAGQFIDWFFTEYDTGVSEDYASLMATHGEHTKAVPDAGELARWIDRGDSGVSNDQTIEFITSAYQQVLEQYRKARARGGQQRQQSYPGGNWTEVPGQQSQSSPQQGGSWQSVPGEQPSPQQPQQMQQPQQGMGPQHPQQGQNQQTEMMMKMFEQMQQSQQEMLERMENMVQSNQGQQEEESLTDSVEELVRVQQVLSELNGDETDGEVQQAIAALQQQIQQVQQQQSGSGSMEVSGTEDAMAVAMMNMANSGDVDPNTMAQLAETMGYNSDPEVRKAEIEQKTELQKAETKKEMVNQAFESLGDGAGNLLGSLIRAAGQNQPQREQNMGADLETDPAHGQGRQGGQQRVSEMSSPQRQRHVADEPETDARGESGEFEVVERDDSDDPVDHVAEGDDLAVSEDEQDEDVFEASDAVEDAIDDHEEYTDQPEDEEIPEEVEA